MTRIDEHAYAKLATDAKRDTIVVQPDIKDSDRDIEGGARAAVHQYVAPLTGIEEQSSPAAKTWGKSKMLGIIQPLS